jgi:hypothetical protein
MLQMVKSANKGRTERFIFTDRATNQIFTGKRAGLKAIYTSTALILPTITLTTYKHIIRSILEYKHK